MIVRRPLPLLCLAAAFMLAGMAHADDGRRGDRGDRGARSERVDRAAPPRRGPEQRRPPQALAPPAAIAPAPRTLRPEAREDRARRQDALSDSVRRVQSRTGGQVLSAERVPFEGRDINRVKVVDERGRVRVYMDDPSSRRPPRPTRGDDD